MAQPTFTGLARIGQINVVVHDLARATAFYRDALGMKFSFEAPRMAFFDCDGIRLLLALPEGEGTDHLSSVLYFEVDDINAATAELKNRSVTFGWNRSPIKSTTIRLDFLSCNGSFNRSGSMATFPVHRPRSSVRSS